MQNTSNAVMATRIEPADSPDDFPTPPWATRALIEHVLDKAALATMSCLEPACGAGHMAKALKEYFRDVTSSDAYPYGYGHVRDFLTDPYGTDTCDGIVSRRLRSGGLTFHSGGFGSSSRRAGRPAALRYNFAASA